MKSILKTLAVVLTLAFTAVSCSSDNDDSSAASRDIKYEVTGNYAGQLDATYIEKGGNALNENINALPWTKEFTADAGTNGVTLNVGGTGGTAGQTITVKIYAGGNVVKELTATANNDGIIVAVLTPYVFPL
ncbi:hypothetical protein [Flavobacterium defluvii]|uniref:MmpS family membrane protein n=1 Tax=Flavobacterium defluvii TaxID=370979 RepID=A0A1M5LVR4_9FLAO|nr:hypothetical protein [Flavobacterium defluvii]SHG69194.1 hypothetical protein SAMN05443663_103478 [Flavobacterium defluvii]